MMFYILCRKSRLYLEQTFVAVTKELVKTEGCAGPCHDTLKKMWLFPVRL